MTTQPLNIDPAPLTAIDVHVHLEAEEASESDAAARDYFGDSGAPRDPDGLAEYYRYLNCGYRLPLVGGTDKMSNSVPVGH